jgi:tetratricopeptide (TPR) repeat protein
MWHPTRNIDDVGLFPGFRETGPLPQIPLVGIKVKMFRDNFDRLCGLFLIVVLISLAALLSMNNTAGGEKRAAGSGKALERELAYRARIELIAGLYAPVEKLRKDGSSQTALLKLDELIRKYPSEGHGHILQGEILLGMGALDEALSSYREGVKLNGDYVDAKSPLSRRAEIQRLVDEVQKDIARRTAAGQGTRSLAASREKVNYLKSRLAGGCE